jgi:2-keto-3-deoxy-6-phosphogluconate aldolase
MPSGGVNLDNVAAGIGSALTTGIEPGNYEEVEKRAKQIFEKVKGL